MIGWKVFEGAVEPPVPGCAIQTILRLPDDVASALSVAGGTSAEGEIAGHPVNPAVTRAAEVKGLALWTRQSLPGRTEIPPGERVEVLLHPVPPEAVDTPEDLAAALRRTDRTAGWKAPVRGRREALVNRIGTEKSAATRDKRIATVIEGLVP